MRTADIVKLYVDHSIADLNTLDPLMLTISFAWLICAKLRSFTLYKICNVRYEVLHSVIFGLASPHSLTHCGVEVFHWIQTGRMGVCYEHQFKLH